MQALSFNPQSNAAVQDIVACVDALIEPPLDALPDLFDAARLSVAQERQRLVQERHSLREDAYAAATRLMLLLAGERPAEPPSYLEQITKEPLDEK
jgi:hypothetical protein